MARQTLKVYDAAWKYPYGQRFPGGLPSPTPYDHDFANNLPLTWSDAADVTSIHGLSLDADNVFRMDRSCLIGAREIIPFYLATAGALATQTFFTATRPIDITGITEIHATAETAAGTATLTVTHDVAGQAPGTGTVIMVGTFNLKGTANTEQVATLLPVNGDGTTNSSLTLALGDALSLVVGGTATITALAGVTLSVYAAPGLKEVLGICNMQTSPATQSFFVANRDYQVVGAYLRYKTAASGASAITLNITADTSTTAPGAGTSILAAAQSVVTSTAINTTYNLPLSATAANLILRAGTALSVLSSGSWSGLAGVVVVVALQSLTTGYIGQVDLSINMAAPVTQGIFLADRDYEVVDYSERYSTASGGGGTVDLTIDKGAVAPGAGLSALSAALNLSGTANTIQVASLNASRRQKLLSKGDLLTAKIGSPSAAAGFTACVSLLPR
jgi:hypothetical protein